MTHIANTKLTFITKLQLVGYPNASDKYKAINFLIVHK